MSNRRGISRIGLLIIAAILCAGAGIAVWMGRLNQHEPIPPATPPNPSSFSIPPFSESRFLNVGPEAHYIGSAACTACHENNSKSYHLTPHSRALADLDPNAEPEDGLFEHPLSGRSYRVYRKDGQLRHEEVLRTAEGKEIARIDLPIRYVIGSGHFTRSYLVEVEGFLHESPITWYAAKRKWDMSPGYDVPQHSGFERPVPLACVACHAGRVEEIDGTFHRLKFIEKAIGCENCHGPGSLHQDIQHGSPKLAPGETDRTIVNPAKLSRSLQESICAACHLSNTALVTVRGREPEEFRPGRPLSDYRIHYRLAGGGNEMTVVGHVEQLRQSVCYQKSERLTCVSCHDPHRSEVLQEKTTFYREKCLGCHSTQQCKLDRGERLKKEGDNCIACHMPRGETEIPHIAFTHHRIGRHAAKPVKQSGHVPELVTDDDLSSHEPLDQQRSLGLAYLKLSLNSDYGAFADNFRFRATKLLEGVANAGLRDIDMTLALAELNSVSNPSRAAALAREVLEQHTSPYVRSQALAIVVDQDFQSRNYPGAINALDALTRLRRNAEDWRMIGLCYLRLNDPQKALPAFQNALSIRPYRAEIYEGFEELYRRQGDLTKADEYQKKAHWLKLHRRN